MGLRKAVPVEQLSADTRHLFDVLNKQADLPCVVVGAAFLDAALKALLAKKLLRSSTADKLLNEDGALGNFVARADLAYCLDLVDKQQYQDLNRHLQLDFADQKVRELCGNLNEWKVILHGGDEDDTFEQTQEQLTTTARNQFNLSVAFLANRLLLTALGPI